MVLTNEQKKVLPTLLDFARSDKNIRSAHLERIEIISKQVATFEHVDYNEYDARALNIVRQYYIIELKLNKHLGK